ncbi:MAG: hypothetical protein LBD31_04320 [Treponema sp.]|jgi:hypothetical protein|nr:hypothetical protein [Treponema sp.]
MLDVEQLTTLKKEIDIASKQDLFSLNQLRAEIKLLGSPRQIRDYTTTAISLVASDGGNNRLQFDPFEIQVIRVVDSYGHEACLQVISRYRDIMQLSKEQFNPDKTPKTALGYMMFDLDVKSLLELSPMLRPKKDSSGRDALSSSWILVYRELVEWAILYERIRNGNFVTDTLIAIDGLLRSKVFAGDLFVQLILKIQKYIQQIKQEHRRQVYLVGVSKSSKVLDRYRLAMMLEGVMREPRPVFVKVPQEIEDLAYDWPEYTLRPGDEKDNGERAKYAGGYLFLAKFGPSPSDPIWPVDILIGQESEAEKIIAYLKTDAENGFPVPFYPKCIQKAHEYSAIAGIDMEILQQEIINALLKNMSTDKDIQNLEKYILLPKDPGGMRYE